MNTGRWTRGARLGLSALAALAVLHGAAWAKPFTDGAGRTVELPDKIMRVFPAGPPANVLVYAVAPELMLGWTRAPEGPVAEYIPEPYRKLPELGRLTGRGDTANRESVLLAKPDLIVDYGAINPTYIDLANRVQSQLGIPYILLDGSFAKIPATLRALGALLGKGADGEKLAAYAERTSADARAFMATVPPGAQPSVYYGRGGDGLQTGLPGSINVELLDVVGFRNVAADAGQGRLALVSMEQVLRWNPDVILTIDRHFAATVRSDARWQALPAVRAGRVYRSPDLPFGWFDQPPSVNRLIGIHWLLHVVYPDRHKGDLAALAKEFYRLFYHLDLTDAQIAALLDTAPGR